MERLNTDVGSVKSAFQEAPEILKRIGVDFPLHIGDCMIDNLMRVLPFQSLVGKQFIGIERGASLDPLLDFFMQGLFLPVLDNNSLDFSAALHETDHGSLIFSARSGDAALPLRDVHVPGLAADEGLVNLDFARGFHDRAGLHSLADTMHHEPCRPLHDAQITPDFIATDSVLAVGKQPDSGEPLIHSKRGVLENGADFQSELLLASLTLPTMPASDKPMLLGGAMKASHLAFGPAQLDRIREATFRIGEVFNRFFQGLWGLEFCAHG